MHGRTERRACRHEGRSVRLLVHTERRWSRARASGIRGMAFSTSPEDGHLNSEVTSLHQLFQSTKDRARRCRKKYSFDADIQKLSIVVRLAKGTGVVQGRGTVGGEANTKSLLESGMFGNGAECTGVRFGLQ